MHNWIDIFWQKRANQQWIEDHNCNTKFFHRVANSRGKSNAIQNIVVDGELHIEGYFVKGAIVHFFAKLRHENFPSRPFLEGFSYNTITLSV